MISRITGQIKEKNSDSVVVEVGGIGLNVFMLNKSLEKIKSGKVCELFTHLVVRENLLDLYGFLTKNELATFEMLISVSGIGPKGAMGVLSQAGPEEIQSAIMLKDYSVLTRVSGIGKKTAERIVLELKGKIAKIETGTSGTQGERYDNESIEALEALLALGYSREQARQALQEVPSEAVDAGEKVKQALRLLAKRGRN